MPSDLRTSLPVDPAMGVVTAGLEKRQWMARRNRVLELLGIGRTITRRSEMKDQRHLGFLGFLGLLGFLGTREGQASFYWFFTFFSFFGFFLRRGKGATHGPVP